MIIAALVILGLCFGSFVNALVWRLHQQSLPKKKRAAKDAELSIATGRSMCPDCKHTLAWHDLVPVISWISLRGKCRYCKHKVSTQYPAVELLTAALFVASYVFWPLTLQSNGFEVVQFALWLSCLVGLIALLVYDLKWMLLPNRLTGPLVVIAGMYAAVGLVLGDNGFVGLLKLVGAVLVTAGLFYLLFQVSDGKWIGGGDVKLAISLGLLVGSVEMGFLVLFLASVLGLIFMMPSVIRGQSGLTAKLPFGPFLIMATFITVLFGNSLVDWYVNTVLFV